MPGLRLAGIEKVYPGGHAAVAGVDLEIAAGELVVLLGPSGCGKSTLLRIVAGVEVPTQGRIFIDDREITGLPPQKRDVAMVFQNYALYPHMSLRDNLGFGLKMRGADRAHVAARVQEVAASLGLAELLDRKPAQLSGGQRQRVALGRAIARNARVFLLDEPLSNLDVQLRVSTRQELARLHRTLHVPMLYVTHDQEEAMTLGDRVAVMNSGRVLQIGAPMEIYARPATRFVGGFVGSPRMNFFPGELRHMQAGGFEVVALGGELRLHLSERRATTRAADAGSEPAGVEPDAGRQEVIVGIRPEDIELRAAAAADLVARVDLVEPLGRELLLHVVAGAGPDAALQVLRAAGTDVTSGSMLGLAFRRDRIHLFDAATEKRLADPTAEATLAGRP